MVLALGITHEWLELAIILVQRVHVVVIHVVIPVEYVDVAIVIAWTVSQVEIIVRAIATNKGWVNHWLGHRIKVWHIIWVKWIKEWIVNHIFMHGLLMLHLPLPKSLSTAPCICFLSRAVRKRNVSVA